MGVADFLLLPPAIRIVFVVMLWPAIWAAALMVVSVAGDVIRRSQLRTSPASSRIA